MAREECKHPAICSFGAGLQFFDGHATEAETMEAHVRNGATQLEQQRKWYLAMAVLFLVHLSLHVDGDA